MEQKLYCIKDNKIIKIEDNSKNMAKNIHVFNEFSNTKEDTIARNIRKSIESGKSYKGYYFQRIDI